MKSNVTRRGRDGFTLIEVLVTLILLAVLAAAVFPVVTQQSDQGDPVRVASDLAAMRTGVEQFRLDVRPNYPQDLEDLVYPLSVQSDQALGSTAYSNPTKWKGPYIDAGLTEVISATPSPSTQTIGTAFDALIQPALVCVDPTGSAAVTCAVNKFVAIEVTQLDSVEARKLEGQVDGTAGGVNQTGKFRYPAATNTGLAFYVVGPFF
jgi:type IV pilus assembly protein PilE